MESLQHYIEENINMSKDNIYYNESFCNLTQDYLSSMGEFSPKDIEYLKVNEYYPEDFEDDENE